jgi:hypothetical protein
MPVARDLAEDLEQPHQAAAGAEVIDAGADHAALVDQDADEGPLLGVHPRYGEVLDVGDAAEAEALELGAGAVVEGEIGVGERGRRHPGVLVLASVQRIELLPHALAAGDRGLVASAADATEQREHQERHRGEQDQLHDQRSYSPGAPSPSAAIRS